MSNSIPKVNGVYSPQIPKCKCVVHHVASSSETANNMSSAMRIGHILQNTAGGRPTHEFIGARVNYVGRLDGQSGGAGAAIKNRFI
jgi:hypothetical protein